SRACRTNSGRFTKWAMRILETSLTTLAGWMIWNKMSQKLEKCIRRYWVDWAGRLWRGPSNLSGNLHYATFDGYMTVAPFHPIWTLQRSDPPEDANEVEEEFALMVMRWFQDKP